MVFTRPGLLADWNFYTDDRARPTVRMDRDRTDGGITQAAIDCPTGLRPTAETRIIQAGTTGKGESMRIDNQTGYRARDIRKLFLAAFKAEGVSPKYYRIWILPTRRLWIHGRAGLGSRRITMFIPQEWDTDINQTGTNQFARIFVHEIGHTLGLVHKEQINIWTIPTPWADGLELRRKLERPKIPVRQRRFDSARRKLDEHTRKLKREQNLVRKWRTKVRYYERTLATAAGQ